ncbi:MAG: hypothetical protein HY305_04405 [Sphingobacteriales bacterium]|nr:hypothetical protein [Sphingobacteriales bacterium]
MRIKFYCLALTILISTTFGQAQNVALNNDGSLPDSSAMFDIKSNSKGVLVPRMTYTERSNLQRPAAGLLVYQTEEKTTAPAGFYYNAGTADEPAWKRIAGGDVKRRYTVVVAGPTNITVPAGITRVYFEAVSGGGGRGGSYFNGSTYYFGGTGAGGGYGSGYLNVTPGQVLTVTVGMGGTNGTDGTTPTNGSYGGNTTINIGATIGITIGGGPAGFAATSTAGGAGGTGGGSIGSGPVTVFDKSFIGIYGNAGNAMSSSAAENYGASGFAPIIGEYNYLMSQNVKLAGNTPYVFICPGYGKGGGATNAIQGYVTLSY